MPKQDTISFKANFPEVKEERDENGNIKVAHVEASSYSGTVLYNMPETVEEALQMFGEQVVLTKFVQSVTIDVQSICRRYKTQEEAQEAVNGYVPGIAKRSAGPSMKQVKEVMSKMSKEELQKLIESL